MKAVKILIHLSGSLLIAFLAVGVPSLIFFPPFGQNGVDVVSGASLTLPDKPSGEFVVLLNRSLHEEDWDKWVAFLRDGELDVIFDDIHCLVPSSDMAARQMAERFQAQLPENQWQMRTEDPMLLVSKAENGCLDAAVLSKELADSLQLRITADNVVQVIMVKDGDAA